MKPPPPAIVNAADFLPDPGLAYPGDEQVLCHSAGEYVRDEAHTNTMDGYWGLFKRGMKGIYQH
ncbi:MAG TPA: hypothetical protein VGC46_13420, partial [Allosphingosinicella sp.]